MATQFTRSIVGACVVVSFAALVLPQFFHENGDCGCANCNGSVCAEVKPVTPQDDADISAGVVDEGGEAAGVQSSDEADSGVNSGEHDIVPAASPEDEGDGGYGALLEEDGAPAPADSANSDNRSGVVVGVRPANSNQNVNANDRANFVSNPVATGTSPADAARIRAEKQRENAELQRKQEAERRAQQAALKKQEAERKAQEALEAKKKQEAEHRAALLEAQKKQEAERRVALLEAQKKQEAERLAALEAQKKQEANKQSAARQTPRVPSGRYLQLGVFSSYENAEAARRGKKFSMSRADLQKAGAGFGFKIDSQSSPGKYILLLGPSKSDEVLQSLKAKNFNGAFTVSR